MVNQLIPPTWDPMTEFAARGWVWLIVGTLVVLLAGFWTMVSSPGPAAAGFQDHTAWPRTVLFIVGTWMVLEGAGQIAAPHLTGLGL